MKEYFEGRRLTGSIKIRLEGRGIWTADKADICNSIINVVARFRQLGYRLSLRQLYYQLVAADTIPNHDKVYKKISSLLDDLRYSGVIDWDAIEDRGRVPYLPYFVEGIKDALLDAAKTHRLDRQEGQEIVIEVWTEKDALSGILRRVTSHYHVNLVVNKGYSSSTAMHNAYERFAEYINEGKRVKVLYLGDHDPSGLDMVRDINERINFFLTKGQQMSFDLAWQYWEEKEYNIYDLRDFSQVYQKIVEEHHSDNEFSEEAENLFECGVKEMYLHENNIFQVAHIGLTMEQIRELNPPPNPAKMTDPRAAGYISEFGRVSWEVDAIDPQELDRMVRDAIEADIDMNLFREMLEREQSERDTLAAIASEH